MRKPLWVLLAVLLAIPAASLAQYNEEVPAKMALRGGIYQPAGSAMRDQSSAWPAFGVDYVLAFDEAQKPEYAVALSYTGATKDLLNAKIIGLQYTKYWSNSPEPDKGLYYGMGPGVYSEKVDLAEEFSRPAIHESKTQVGFNVLGGYHLSPYWFVEVRYTKLGKLATGIDFSGFSVYLGVKRFLE